MIRQLAVAAAVFLLVLLVGLVTVLGPALDRIYESRDTIERLIESYVSAKRLLVNREAHLVQLRELRPVVRRAMDLLPTRFDPSLAAARQVAGDAGLRVDAFEPGPERLREFYAERPVRLEASGRYHQVGAFVAALNGIPGVVRLESFSMERATTPGTVTFNATLRMLRYLEDDEVIAQRRNAKGSER